MKKLLSTFLMITILFSFSACSQQSTDQNQIEINESPVDVEAVLDSLNESDRAEVQTALDHNIISPDFLVSLDDGINKEQMIDLIENCLVYLGYETDSLFEYQIKGDNATILTRDNAAKLIIYAMTDILEISIPNGNARGYAPGASSVENAEGISRLNHELLVGQFDLTNGLSVMETDGEYRFHSTDVMTKLEAIKSLARLSNSILPEPEYVDIASLSETINYPEELLNATKSLPEIDPNNLPFKGIDINFGLGGSSPVFIESDVALIHDIGFNFIRAQIDTDMFYNPENPNEIDMVHLRNLDELVEWGMKYQVHICFALFLWDPDLMEPIIPQFWDTMSQRYANVPANILSFNLINEPYDRPSEEILYSIYDRSIESIHGLTPDRLIFIDSILNNEKSWFEVNDAWYPLEEMVGKDVILAYHSYQPENVLGIVDGYPPQDSWPFPFVNTDLGTLEEGGEPIIIEGNFPENTKIILRTISSYENSGIQIKLDGNTLYEASLPIIGEDLKLDTEVILPEAGNIIEIYAIGECQRYGYITIIYPELAEEPVPYFLTTDSIPEYYSENKVTHIITSGSSNEGFNQSRIIIDDNGIYHTEGDGLLEYNKDYFENIVKVWKEFQDTTGTPVMMQELTMYSQYPTQNLYLGLLDDYLTLLDENDIPWSTWDWERLIQIGRNYNETNTTWIRMGNHYVNKELLEVLQKHINN